MYHVGVVGLSLGSSESRESRRTRFATNRESLWKSSEVSAGVDQRVNAFQRPRKVGKVSLVCVCIYIYIYTCLVVSW